MHEITDAQKEQVEKNLERAKKFLLDLVKHPEKLDSVPDDAVIELEETAEPKGTLTVILRDERGKIIEKRAIE